MSVKLIQEFEAKKLIKEWMVKYEFFQDTPLISIKSNSNYNDIQNKNNWVQEQNLVVKVDQLIKRRGKSGLIGLNMKWDKVCEWIEHIKSKEITVGKTKGYVENFIVEPFIEHKDKNEYYLSIISERDGDKILFHHQGGINVGDIDKHALTLFIPISYKLTLKEIIDKLLSKISNKYTDMLATFINILYDFYCTLHFTYFEINPLVIIEGEKSPKLIVMDVAAKLDEAARYQCNKYWGDTMKFIPPFGKKLMPEENYIHKLDLMTGASLKLTILNHKARIWTMVAGGGASVIYTDTIFALTNDTNSVANYGEYSGAPSESLTYQYAKTILKLMTEKNYKHSNGKILLIGGGIANFTNIAETFKGIAKALLEFRKLLLEYKVNIYIRRGGPNYQSGLEYMRSLRNKLEIPIEVYGPETNMTAIISKSLNIKPILLSNERKIEIHKKLDQIINKNKITNDNINNYIFFDKNTTAAIYGMQPGAVQNMLDFDYISRRDSPSVSCIIYPFSNGCYYKQFYWASKEIMIPVFSNVYEALKKYPEVNVVINFASSRSAYESTIEIMKFSQIKFISIIAEGMPERHTRELIYLSKKKSVSIIGPATVGGIKPGCFRIGNTGGMLDNISSSKLYRAGSVGYVSRSGGLSNELNNIISKNCDGVFEGIAIGGDRYPIATYMDILIRYEKEKECKILVLIGEVGGTLEYEVCEAIKSKVITKPLIAWCTGTCAEKFSYDVQFGHAGALAQSKIEKSSVKNEALRKAGAFVPNNFEELPELLKEIYDHMVDKKIITPKKDIKPPNIPIDFKWATQIGLIRKPSMFLSSIVDDRANELCYSGVPITSILENDMGVGSIIGLLWFKKKLPRYAAKFFEMLLILIADHGPAVSGAHNTIVTTRAGKDLISSLVSGLLTIGPRFGGALDGAAEKFSYAYDNKLSPVDFVKEMRAKRELIMGIGHKKKSIENPDKRVKIIIDYCKKHFKSTEILNYALKVEAITTKKKSNLILNVDGAIGAAFVDLLRTCGLFSCQEIKRYIEMGSLNGIFVLGRSIGFIGHHLDQKRLKQGLYRHPTDDIAYISNNIDMFSVE